MLKRSPRLSKWTLGSPNSESRWKSYASGKITDAALPGRSTSHRPAGRPGQGRPAWHLPKMLATHHYSLGDSPMDPQILGRQARSESKTETPHMSHRWAPKMATRCWVVHPRIGAAPTCKERMEVNTSGEMDELITWINGPTFRMNNVQPT
jgi:hypothetical protein